MRLGRFFSLGFSAALLVGLLGGSDAAFAQANGPALDAPAAPGAAEELPAPEAVADPAKAKPAARPAEANPLAPAAARPRRYFGRWEKSPNGAYFSKKFYYRPDPNGAAEKRQYVVFYPSSLDYLYLFDPEARVYWGRFDRFAPPDVCFQAIAQNEQRTRLWDIPEPAYGKSGPLPRLPGAVDDLRLLSPTETPALLDPQDAPDVDPREAAAADERKPAPPKIATAKRPPARLPVRVVPPIKPPYHYQYITTTERKWISRWTYTTTIIDGQPVTVPVRTGYWKEYPVTKKVRVPN